LPGEWLNQAGDGSRRVAAALEGGWHSLAQPERAARLRKVLIGLFLLWAVFSVVQLIWSLVPGKAPVMPDKIQLLNPITQAAESGTAAAVDIDALVGRHLFGKPQADGGAERRAREERLAQQAASERAGIEKGARETRLDLRLVGVVASSEDGLGHAMIEHRKKQDIYAVDDKLPVSGRVTLAKVMPQQVVLNNGGTYELLKLFDKEGLSAQVPAPASRRQSRPSSEAVREVSGGERADELARQYRDQLYTNPQSLAEVVRVSAVREGNNLVGYRIAPGREPEQLTALGLRDGDLVTAVNGIALDDPSNTVKLYQAMRTAQEATFEIQRNGRPFTVSVNLADPAEGR